MKTLVLEHKKQEDEDDEFVAWISEPASSLRSPWIASCEFAHSARHTNHLWSHLPAGHDIAWLQDVYSASAKDDAERAMCLIYDNVDETFRRTHFSVADSALESLDLKRVRQPNVVVAFLAATWPGRERLKARKRFVEYAQSELQKKLPAEEVDQILEHLK